jgi:tetratricopeptide (TPR) repeat protein
MRVMCATALFALSIGVPGAGQSAPAAPDVGVLLAAYSRGDFGQVNAGLGALTDLATFRRALEAEVASRKLTAKPKNPSPALQRDRLIVAALALEAASRLGAVRTQWPHAVALIEWACTLVRMNSPQPAEYAWHRVAIAVLESGPRGPYLEFHVRHALRRFEGDPHLLLARAFAHERLLLASNSIGVPEDPADPATLVKDLEDLLKYGDVRTEASVRLGYVLLRANYPQRAREQLTAAAAATDPDVRYLANLFLGRTFDRLNRETEATAAYLEAHRAVPAAQTAAFALAADLARKGDRAEAERMILEAVTSTPDRDPWLFYLLGDGRLGNQLIAQLREALR